MKSISAYFRFYEPADLYRCAVLGVNRAARGGGADLGVTRHRPASPYYLKGTFSEAHNLHSAGFLEWIPQVRRSSRCRAGVFLHHSYTTVVSNGDSNSDGPVDDHLHDIGTKIYCDSDFESISTGSWERARVMETSSRRTLRGLSRSSQRQFSA